jgi:hypothetical protein
MPQLIDSRGKKRIKLERLFKAQFTNQNDNNIKVLILVYSREHKLKRTRFYIFV